MATKAMQMRVDELEKLVSTLSLKITELEGEKKEIRDEPKEAKKTTKGFKQDGTPRKKRSPCGYMVFSNEKRVEVRAKMLEDADGEKIHPGIVVRKLAGMWNALDDEDKKIYNDQAKLDAEEAEIELETN